MAFGQSIRFAKAFIEVGLDATEAQKSLRKFRNQFRSMRRIGIGVGAGITAAMTPVVALLTKATIEAAKFEESLSRFNQEFKSLAPDAQRFVDSLVNGLGQSRQTMTDMMSEFNSMLKRGGAANAFELSKMMTQLSVDMGSFFNRDSVEVQRDLLSMLAGSSEVMEKYGVNVKMAAVNQELLNQQIDPKKATEYQKSLARINITMRETADAQGDLSRTQGSLTNQFRSAQNEIKNALLELGRELLPTITATLRDLNEALDAMKPIIKDVAGIIGPLAKEVTGRGTTFGPSRQAANERQFQARQLFGDTLGRALALGGAPFMGGQLSAFTSTEDLKKERDRRILKEALKPRPSEAAQAAGPGGGEGGNVDDMLAATRGGGLMSLAGRMAGNAGFRARAFVRGMTRQFGPQIMDARRGLKEQIKGMRAVRDAQLRAPKSSHETFSVAAFGGDFTRMSDTVESTQKELLEVTKELLAFIKENRVVFG